MEKIQLKISSSVTHFNFIPCHPTFLQPKISSFGSKKFAKISHTSSLCCTTSNVVSFCLAGDRHRQISSLESLFCYDKAIPEQIIEKPLGLSIADKEIGDQPSCTDCQAKGAVLCTTCSGSGLYVDSILESQGVIVKVRCLSCGGTGNIMCSDCGGRGHL